MAATEDWLQALAGGLRGYSFYQDEERSRKERDEIRRAAVNRQGVEDMDRQYAVQENARRYEESQRQARAGVAADGLSGNDPIDDLTYSFLQGTPYESRVQSSRTLPTRGMSADMAMTPGGADLARFEAPETAGGDLVRTWRPNRAEMKATERDAALTDVLNDPAMARYGGRIKAGLGTGELPHERAQREAAGDVATGQRELDRDTRQQANVLEQIKLRDRLSPDRPTKAAPTPWDQFGEEYRTYVAIQNESRKANEANTNRLGGRTLVGPPAPESAKQPLPFDRWLAEVKGVQPGAGAQPSPLPVTPRAPAMQPAGRPRLATSHTQTTPTAGGSKPKVGSTVTVGGKTYVVGTVYADGSWDPQ